VEPIPAMNIAPAISPDQAAPQGPSIWEGLKASVAAMDPATKSAMMALGIGFANRAPAGALAAGAATAAGGAMQAQQKLTNEAADRTAKATDAESVQSLRANQSQNLNEDNERAAAGEARAQELHADSVEIKKLEVAAKKVPMKAIPANWATKFQVPPETTYGELDSLMRSKNLNEESRGFGGGAGGTMSANVQFLRQLENDKLYELTSEAGVSLADASPEMRRTAKKYAHTVISSAKQGDPVSTDIRVATAASNAGDDELAKTALARAEARASTRAPAAAAPVVGSLTASTQAAFAKKFPSAQLLEVMPDGRWKVKNAQGQVGTMPAQPLK
jgi:hypothetical protein